MALLTLQPVSLGSAGVTKPMVQEQIADDASVLGLAREGAARANNACYNGNEEPGGGRRCRTWLRRFTRTVC